MSPKDISKMIRIKFLISFIVLKLSNNILCQEYVNGDSSPLFRFNRLEDVFLRMYNGSSTKYYVEFRLSQAHRLLNVAGFKINNPTVFYAHGYTASANSESVQVMATAYIEARPETNFVLIDWSNMALGDYTTNAALNTKKVGIAAAAQIQSLVNAGLPLNNIHLMGHSLGIQLVGYTARQLKNTYNMQIKRVTGLDPAFPAFYPEVLLKHIRATDAEFVDIIHTDAGGYGTPVSTGTVDFWPNGGASLQPGCLLTQISLTSETSCSHTRSWRYFAESVRNPTAFPAAAADSYSKFLSSSNNAVAAYMGYNCDTSARGNLYLKTNRKSPFAKYNDGIRA